MDVRDDPRDVEVPERSVRPLDARNGDRARMLQREHEVIRVRGSLVRVSPTDFATLFDIGRFRTVAVTDLARHRYSGQSRVLDRDLKALASQGLLRRRTVWNGPKTRPLEVVVLTKAGKWVLESRAGRSGSDRTSDPVQALYSGFVKRNEVRHDAAIYRMYQAEVRRLQAAGTRIRRVVLDYELKRLVYTPLAKARALPEAEFAQLQAAVARANGLKVIEKKIPLPDLRIEYETAAGDLAKVDLELATGHYHGRAMATKARAGFHFYAADGSASKLSRVLEERDITVAILSL